MNWQRIKQTCANYCISFFELQFVISLMSLPILISWGIPISIMSPLANFIFTPLLILFLWCSCLTTVCILTHIPSSFFESILQKITTLWLYLLSFSKPEWLLGFPTKMLTISIIICIFIFLLYTYLKPKALHSMIILCTIWCMLIAIRPYYTQISGVQKIGELPLWITRIHNKTYLIDHGALCNRKNLFNNLDYTVLPELIRQTGHPTIDTLILCKPSSKIVKVAQQCTTQLNLDTILVTPNANCFKKLQAAFQKTDINVIPLCTKNSSKKNSPKTWSYF